MSQARFVFHFESVDDACVITQALAPEMKQQIPKTKVRLHQVKKEMQLTILSSDTSSLRAACNSYLRWITTALQVKHLV